MLLQLGDPAPRSATRGSNSTRSITAVSIPVYQPPDPAPQGANAALSLLDVGIGLTFSDARSVRRRRYS